MYENLDLKSKQKQIEIPVIFPTIAEQFNQLQMVPMPDQVIKVLDVSY